MANRYTFRATETFEKRPVVIYGNVAIGASGAPTINASKSIGILSITRSSTGKYVITFGGPAGVDTYQRVLDCDFTSIISTTSAVVSMNIVSDATASTGKVTVQFVSAAGTPADLANGEILLLRFELSNTTA